MFQFQRFSGLNHAFKHAAKWNWDLREFKTAVAETPLRTQCGKKSGEHAQTGKRK